MHVPCSLFLLTCYCLAKLSVTFALGRFIYSLFIYDAVVSSVCVWMGLVPALLISRAWCWAAFWNEKHLRCIAEVSVFKKIRLTINAFPGYLPLQNTHTFIGMAWGWPGEVHTDPFNEKGKILLYVRLLLRNLVPSSIISN